LINVIIIIIITKLVTILILIFSDFYSTLYMYIVSNNIFTSLVALENLANKSINKWSNIWIYLILFLHTFIFVSELIYKEDIEYFRRLSNGVATKTTLPKCRFRSGSNFAVHQCRRVGADTARQTRLLVGGEKFGESLCRGTIR